MEERKQQIEKKLGIHKHVFKFWDKLNDEEKLQLLHSVETLVDPQRLENLFTASLRMSKNTSIQTDIEPPVHLVEKFNEKERQELYDEGLKLYAEGKVGLLLLAGGQGTRLGSKDPKGMYDIGLPSKKSLFQIQAERIVKLQKLAAKKYNKEHVYIPFYIMANEESFDTIVQFFEKHNYFGLKKEFVIFFKQPVLPCFDKEGRIMLESKSKLAVAPNGNGGVYEALESSKLYDHMEQHGVEYIHSFPVDNILISVGAPDFIAACVRRNADYGSKVVPKAHAHEKVGVFGIKNGKAVVVEYSEITKEMAERRDPKTNELLFNASNICIFFYTVEFLKLCSQKIKDIHEYHLAYKKIDYADEEGNTVTPTVENGIKLELFNFDISKFANKVVLFEVDRKFEFSPLKNAPGEKSCTPEICRNDLYWKNIQLLKKAGAKIEGEGICEISPLLSCDGEDLDIFKDKTIQLPVVINEDGSIQQL